MVDKINGQNNIHTRYNVADKKQGEIKKNDNPPDWFKKALEYIKDSKEKIRIEDPGYTPLIVDDPKEYIRPTGIYIDEPDKTRDPGYPTEKKEPGVIFTPNYYEKQKTKIKRIIDKIFSQSYQLEDNKKLKRLERLRLSLDNNSPLDGSGCLKEGWQYCPQTGEYRRKPQFDNLLGRESEKEWLDAGSSLGPRDRHIFIPGQTDYQPIFEMRDGKLVPVGKSKVQPKML